MLEMIVGMGHVDRHGAASSNHTPATGWGKAENSRCTTHESQSSEQGTVAMIGGHQGPQHVHDESNTS